MPKKLTKKEFIKRARKVHGNKYDYSLVEYINNSTKIKIVCPIHGVFEQTPNHHLRGQKCKKCSTKIQIKKQSKSTEQFIIDAYCVHGDRYNYKLVDYKNRNTKVNIICPIHGVFEQRPNNHLRYGCNKCGYDIASHKMIKKIGYFIDCANKIHNRKYNYSLIKDIDTINDKVKIICPEHGIFEQKFGNHIYKQYGCPKCASHISKQEIELQKWIKTDINVIFNDRSLISPYELDIVIPEHKLAIEYNGLYWHSETVGKDRTYHLNKYLACKEQGYRLIQIWENEWLLTPDIVKSFLLSAIGIYKYKIGARQTSIQKISSKKARQFYNDNHLQGFQSGIHHGLIYDNELVSLMTIKKYKTGNMLERFVNKKYYQIYGSFSKLLNSFNINDDLYTFADIRHFTGDVYYKCGFKYVHTTKPNYWYFKNNSIIVYHRRHFQKKNIKRRFENGELKHFNPDKTEYQNMIDNGFHRIWDCGNIKFIRKCK